MGKERVEMDDTTRKEWREDAIRVGGQWRDDKVRVDGHSKGRIHGERTRKV